jgi:hypothetical protein
MRVLEIAQKLKLKENAYPRSMLPTWIENSKAYADMMIERYGFNNAQKSEEGYRLLYIMNHVCPNLYHFCKKPNWHPQCSADLKEYIALLDLHYRENSQAGFIDADGNTIQEGITYTTEEFNAFMDAVKEELQ